MQDHAVSDASTIDSLRAVLAVVADNPSLPVAASRLLDIAIAATGAAGGRVLLFVDPRLSVSAGAGETWAVNDQLISQALGDMLPGISPELMSFGKTGRRALGAYVAPVADERIIGGLILLFRGGVPQDISATMVDVANGLRACAVRARSDRHHARLPLAERALLQLPDPVLLLDAEYNILLVNQSAEHAFGVPAAEAEGLSVAQLPGLETLAPGLIEHRLPDSWTRAASDKVYEPRLFRLESSASTGFALIFNDVTRYKKLDRNHSEFVRLVTHDLRTPLTSTMMYCGMLEAMLEGEDDVGKLAIARKLERGLTILNTHVDNVQDAGRYDPETGFYQMSRQPVNLAEMAERVAANQLLPPDKPLTLTVLVDDDLPLLNVDPVMIERATMNLVDNAVKYTPPNGEVELQVHRDENRILIGVRDTGLGIAEEDQKLLFQRHVRLRRREHQQIKGTGLGLFIVRSVALRHSGDAWVESREGEGSTFFFSIPLEGENVLDSRA